MMHKPVHHLAELNQGRLLAPTGDPRVAEFIGAVERAPGLGKRMPGPVWMMQGSGQPGTGNTEARIDGDHAFGWAYLKDARLWRAKACDSMAVE